MYVYMCVYIYTYIAIMYYIKPTLQPYAHMHI